MIDEIQRGMIGGGLDNFIKPAKPGPYIARTASDRDPEWPVWYVAGPDGRLNYLTGIGGAWPAGHVGPFLTDKPTAIALADMWNADV